MLVSYTVFTRMFAHHAAINHCIILFLEKYKEIRVKGWLKTFAQQRRMKGKALSVMISEWRWLSLLDMFEKLKRVLCRC